MTQVHKETLTTIENALPNRSGLDVEIFGMEGIPEDVVASHNQRVLTQFAQAEAERRAATGNPGPGGGGANGIKKQKFEAPSDLKKRLAEHKAKKAAEQAVGFGSGGNTPNGAGQGSQSPGLGQSPVTFVSLYSPSRACSDRRLSQQVGSPAYAPSAMQFGGPSNNSTYSSFPQPYGQTPASYQQQPSQFGQQPATFPLPGAPPAFATNQPYPTPQQFQPTGGQPFSPHFPNGPPQPFNTGSPPGPFPHSQYQLPRTHTPPQNGLPPRSGNLPPASGLPQRPSFGAPPVNAFQMQQLHQGQLPAVSKSPDAPYHHQSGASQHFGRTLGNPSDGNTGAPGVPPASAHPTSLVAPTDSLSANATSLEELLSGAAQEADRAEATISGKADAKAEDLQEEKKGKKEKDKNTKLVYSDNDISPEEKMAQLPRYAFAPIEKDNGALEDTTTAAVPAFSA